MRARASPILHSLFNAARDALVFTGDFLHCILRSGIFDLPGFDADFLSGNRQKSGSSRNVPINSAPTFSEDHHTDESRRTCGQVWRGRHNAQ
jgi:hypothetical protein